MPWDTAPEIKPQYPCAIEIYRALKKSWLCFSGELILEQTVHFLKYLAAIVLLRVNTAADFIDSRKF